LCGLFGGVAICIAFTLALVAQVRTTKTEARGDVAKSVTIQRDEISPSGCADFDRLRLTGTGSTSSNRGCCPSRRAVTHETSKDGQHRAAYRTARSNLLWSLP